ncbi:MAG: cytochrome c oxidase subunit II [Actinomycetota bacterium]|nr:cytochrome c oxidase subunit II [Actinomycetota bacterium]
MGRRRLVFLVTCALALLAVGVAAAGNGGIAPPAPASPNADRIRDSYWLILAFAGAIFVLVEGALLVFILRFRGRGRAREVEGPQLHGSTRLELVWTAVPIVILAVISGFVFYKLPGIQDVPKAQAGTEELRIKVVAHQFYWQFEYPNDVVSIDELRVPTNRVVTLDIESEDVVHSWWIPEFSGKFDAIPGEVNHTWFRVSEAGTYRGRCGEFCGIFHAAMEAKVIATSPAEFDQWISSRTAETLGRDEFVGACQKCHGLGGKGDYGPALTSNPILNQRDELEQIVTAGQGKMPAVGKGWSEEQLDALFAYTSKRVYKPAGTTSGG